MRQKRYGRGRPAMAAAAAAEHGAAEVRAVESAAPARASTEIPVNPYVLGPYAQELLRRRVMISPVLVTWSYRVLEPQRFDGWLATREILLSESRMSGDAALVGIRYGGTYAVPSAGAHDDGAAYKTLWSYDSEQAMTSMHRLCSDQDVRATIVQLELMDFVRGLKRFIATAGDRHFAQDVLIAAAAGRG